MSTGGIMGVVAQHLTHENSYVKNIYIEKESGELLTSFGYNYRLSKCSVNLVEPDPEDPVGAGENAIHFSTCSIQKIVCVSSLMTFDACQLEWTETGIKFSNSRVVFRGCQITITEEVKFENCEVEFHSVIFQGNKLPTCDSCKVALFSCRIIMGELEKPFEFTHCEFSWDKGLIMVNLASVVVKWDNTWGEIRDIKAQVQECGHVYLSEQSDIAVLSHLIQVKECAAAIMVTCGGIMRLEDTLIKVKKKVCLAVLASDSRSLNCTYIILEKGVPFVCGGPGISVGQSSVYRGKCAGIRITEHFMNLLDCPIVKADKVGIVHMGGHLISVRTELIMGDIVAGVKGGGDGVGEFIDNDRIDGKIAILASDYTCIARGKTTIAGQVKSIVGSGILVLVDGEGPRGTVPRKKGGSCCGA